MEKYLKGAFRFVVGFGCMAFFLYWILSRFMAVGGGVGVIILIVALLAGAASAAYPDDEKE